jgi:hypothetical protein
MAPFISSSVRETDSGFLCRELFHIRFGISLIFHIRPSISDIFRSSVIFRTRSSISVIFHIKSRISIIFHITLFQYFISALVFSYFHIRVTSVISVLTFFISGIAFNMFISICYLICSYPEGKREGKGEVRHSRKRQRDKKHTHTV